jgi:DNA-binding response OmpR family regulator
MTTRRVLLVDDEVAILLTLKAVLEINGFTVDTATSAREAEHKLRNADYHMVITDMRMESDAAGIDVVKAAKAAPCNPAVAVLTAFPDEGADYSSDGADELLVKPMNVQQLVVQMEALLVSHEDKKQRAVKLAAAAQAKAKPAAKKKPAVKTATKSKSAGKSAAKKAAKKKLATKPRKRAAAKRSARPVAKKAKKKKTSRR